MRAIEVGYRVCNVEQAQRTLGVERWLYWTFHRIRLWGH